MKKLLCIFVFAGAAFAQISSGPKFPTSASGNTCGQFTSFGGGSQTWSNPSNIEANDGVFSVSALSALNPASCDLIGTGFGFSIPTGATINGILLEINAKVDFSGAGQATQDQHIVLEKASSVVGNDLATGTALTTTATTFSYGGSSNLWGTTWSPSDINNSGFGALAVYQDVGSGGSNNADVDFFRITVTYTPAKAGSQMFKVFSQTRGGPVAPHYPQVYDVVKFKEVSYGVISKENLGKDLGMGRWRSNDTRGRRCIRQVFEPSADRPRRFVHLDWHSLRQQHQFGNT